MMESIYEACKVCKRRQLLTSVILLYTTTLLILPSPSRAEINLPLEHIGWWADEFGEIITGVVTRATGLVDIQAEYVIKVPSVQSLDGKTLVKTMKQDMEDMLQNKVEALSKLVKVAEDAHKEHIYGKDIDTDYPKAKRLNTTEFLLEENEHFNYIPVNLTLSTVHVPTNVYDESGEVLNGTAWSEKLDSYFRENYNNDPTLTWQYFGSATGFFRNYPGMEWPVPASAVDLFDCRTRGWYIQAATSPKDIVILLDASGSMKGLRMEIAKATVEKILETLSDDDFFNVIKFSQEPQYVDDCFNGTLVQANADNKKRIKEALGNIQTEQIAFFENALTEAFKLLHMVNESGKGAQCNRGIMLITDGAPETYEEIFQRYNWPEKNVRVFTFLIGREVGDNRQVVWMACSNKGYYSHISTLADVHEHVQDYIHVISRPMVIERANHTIWTSVYVDAAHDPEGLQLMTSVAAPVYDTKNDTKDDGNLLGVMGTDVPLKELTKLTKNYKLGVNGYAFAITNNGYVLFHPDFRPTEGDLIKPNYNSVDLAEVELLDSKDVIEDPDAPTPFYDMELRRRMVDRDTGNLKMPVKIHYDNMKRVATREQHYYFTEISGTPFSLGISLPADYGQNWVNGSLPLDHPDADLAAFNSELKVAKWNYCKMDTNETLQDPANMLRKYLDYGMKENEIYDEKCDKELMQSILYDAVATRGALSSWMKQNRDGTSNESTSRRNGVELVFLGTKGGLTRYHAFTKNLTDPNFIEENTNTIEELYYIQAVEGGDNVFTFSIPFNAIENFPNIVVTASTPIIVHERESGKKAVAMTVGLQMQYEKFYEFFMNTSSLCPHPDRERCNITCANDSINCFLLDSNGYIVLSEDPRDLGQFYGAKDAMLMKELLVDENQRDSTGVFKQVQLFDYQGVCQIWEKSGSSARPLFINPFTQLAGLLWSFVNKIAWFLVQFNIFTLWPSSLWAASAFEETTDYVPDPENCFNTAAERLGTFLSPKAVYQWRNTLMARENFDYQDCDQIKASYDDTYKRYINRKNEPCVKQFQRYNMIYDNLPFYGTVQNNNWTYCEPESCTRSYSINRVKHTNLMLLVVDAQCNCHQESLPVEPGEVKYNDTMMCQRLQTEIYRKRPSACYASHEKENSKDCGRGSTIQPSILLTVMLLALYFHSVQHL